MRNLLFTGVVAILGLANSSALASEHEPRERTVIEHSNGDRTTVTSDRLGTFAERNTGGSHSTGDSSHEAHERMVREHMDRGDRVVGHDRR